MYVCGRGVLTPVVCVCGLKSLIDFHVSSEVVFFLAYVYVCMQMRVCGRGVLVVCARLLSCDLTSVDFR